MIRGYNPHLTLHVFAGEVQTERQMCGYPVDISRISERTDIQILAPGLEWRSGYEVAIHLGYATAFNRFLGRDYQGEAKTQHENYLLDLCLPITFHIGRV